MFGFGRRKRRNMASASAGATGTASTFVEATGGGWGDPPMRVAANGGSQADYVLQQLHAAREYARENVAVGDTFEYRLTNIPRGISSPHEIMMGLMFQADEYGLMCSFMHDEAVTFIRTS